MVEIEGTINGKPVSILIDPGASMSYISPIVVEKWKLPLQKFENSWLVQLATGNKRKVANFINHCEVIMNDLQSYASLNVLPLGSYDFLIGMDWLEKHKVILNFLEKKFTCSNEKEETVIVKGIPRQVSVR